jgi:HrpA-like RNA helicase
MRPGPTQPESAAALATRLFGAVARGDGGRDPAGGAGVLPIAAHREEILRHIDSRAVTIITGETGSGKTTQVPQYILQQWKGANILVTQPRRIAATSIAQRVATEMGEKGVGGRVGYQIGMRSECSAATRLLFCTTGILLRRLVSSIPPEPGGGRGGGKGGGGAGVGGLTHIILDEMHEMSMEMAFVLMVLRRLLRQQQQQQRVAGFKLVLMSATADAERVAAYFAGGATVPRPVAAAAAPRTAHSGWARAAHIHGEPPRHGRPATSPHGAVPIVRVSGRLFPVTVQYFEEVLGLLRPDAEEHGAPPSGSGRGDVGPYMSSGSRGQQQHQHQQAPLPPPPPPGGQPNLAAHARMAGECECVLDPQHPRLQLEMVELLARLVIAIDAHDRREGAAAARSGGGGGAEGMAAILVFVPGFGEIRSVRPLCLPPACRAPGRSLPLTPAQFVQCGRCIMSRCSSRCVMMCDDAGDGRARTSGRTRPPRADPAALTGRT